jgi:hypothetical protein
LRRWYVADQKEVRLVKEIAQKYGSTINLEDTPLVLVEILRNYGSRFSAPDADSSGPVASTGSVSVQGGTTGGPIVDTSLSDVMRGILQLQKKLSDIELQLKKTLRNTRSELSSGAVLSARVKRSSTKERRSRKGR